MSDKVRLEIDGCMSEFSNLSLIAIRCIVDRIVGVRALALGAAECARVCTFELKSNTRVRTSDLIESNVIPPPP